MSDPESNTSLDPFVTTWHSYPHYAIFATLFDRTADGEFVGYLADSWSFSADGRALTIELIRSARFTDGTPVDAAAVRWNLMRSVDPQVGADLGVFVADALDTVEVLSDYALKLSLTRPYAPLISLLAGIEIASPAAYQQLGAEGFGEHPVGSGPFMLKELSAGNYLVLERNPDFAWAAEEVHGRAGPALLEEVEIRFASEEPTILAALAAGQIHVGEVPAPSVAAMQERTDLQVLTLALPEVRYVAFNTTKPPWDDVRMRRALACAVDRDELVRLAWDGLAEPLYQPLPPAIWGHNPDLDAASFHYDAGRARAELQALGYVDIDGDGLREAPDGQPWVVRLSTGPAEVWRRQADVLVSQFRQVGVRLEASRIEDGTPPASGSSGTPDLMLSMYAYTDPSILTYCFAPYRKGGGNWSRYTNTTVTQLLALADSQLDKTARYSTITQIQRHLIDDCPWICLVTPKRGLGVRQEFRGWQMTTDGILLYLNAYIDGPR